MTTRVEANNGADMPIIASRGAEEVDVAAVDSPTIVGHGFPPPDTFRPRAPAPLSLCFGGKDAIVRERVRDFAERRLGTLSGADDRLLAEIAADASVRLEGGGTVDAAIVNAMDSRYRLDPEARALIAGLFPYLESLHTLDEPGIYGETGFTKEFELAYKVMLEDEQHSNRRRLTELRERRLQEIVPPDYTRSSC